MSSRYHRTICREGIYFLLMVVAVFLWALLAEANLLLLVGGMLCAPMLINWHLCRSSLRGIEVQRRSVCTATAGQPFHVEIELKNTRRRWTSWGLTVSDRIQREGTDHTWPTLRPRLLFWSLSPGEVLRSSYRLVLPNRGRYGLTGLSLTSRFPFGLFRCTRTISPDMVLTVYPAIGQLSPAWQRRTCSLSQGIAGTRRPDRAPGDFFAVREWQSGDSSRWVHWRRSARQGQLIVRQFEQPADRRLILLVDLWQPADPRPEDLDHVELIVSFAATVMADLCRRPGYQVSVGLTGDPPQWSTREATAVTMQETLDRLAVAKAQSVDQLGDLLEASRSEFPNGAEVLVVSPRAGLRTDGLAGISFDAVSQGHIRVIGPTEPKFSEYFKVD